MIPYILDCIVQYTGPKLSSTKLPAREEEGQAAAGAAIEGEPLASAEQGSSVARERGGYRGTFVDESREVSCVLGQETLSSRKWARGGAVV